MAVISRQAAKPGFFLQKALLPHLPSRGKRNCPPAISTPRLGVSQNPPAGRPRALAPDRRAIFMGHSVRILSTEDRPADAGMLSVNWQRPPKAGSRKAQDCGRERACSLAPKAQPVAPGGERVIHSSRPPDRGKKRFWCLLGLWPKGTAARHPCVSCDKLLRRIRAYTFVCLTESAMRRFLWEFCAQRKTSPPVTAPILAPRPNRAAGVCRFGCRLAGGSLLPDARQPHTFVGKQKYAKIAFSACHLAASEIAMGNFDAAAQPKQ